LAVVQGGLVRSTVHQCEFGLWRAVDFERIPDLCSFYAVCS